MTMKSSNIPTLDTHVGRKLAYYVIAELEQLSNSLHTMKPREHGGVSVFPWALEFESPERGVLLSKKTECGEMQTVCLFRREQVATAREAEKMLASRMSEVIQMNDLVAIGYNGTWSAMGVVTGRTRMFLEVILTDIDEVAYLPGVKPRRKGDVVKVLRTSVFLLSRASVPETQRTER